MVEPLEDDDEPVEPELAPLDPELAEEPVVEPLEDDDEPVEPELAPLDELELDALDEDEVEVDAPEDEEATEVEEPEAPVLEEDAVDEDVELEEDAVAVLEEEVVDEDVDVVELEDEEVVVLEDDVPDDDAAEPEVPDDSAEEPDEPWEPEVFEPVAPAPAPLELDRAGAAPEHAASAKSTTPAHRDEGLPRLAVVGARFKGERGEWARGSSRVMCTNAGLRVAFNSTLQTPRRSYARDRPRYQKLARPLHRTGRAGTRLRK